ncbi:restriction endonuclease subunit S [Lysinibacillus sp. C5.1]|uniref:restriction endonuclease subunit S n=1 Tax=Lysinibacillus sp. C5.1 TaxID=2796169 RepID=UPI0030818745
MNIPKLRFKEFNDEWKTYSIGDITESLKSGLSRLLQHQDIGIPVIRANNIENGSLNFNDLKYWYLDDPQGANTSNYLVHKNDILINFINSEAKMGTSAIVAEEPSREMIYTTNILKMNTNKLADNYFFYCYTDSKKYKDYIKLITKPAVNQASFTTVDFKKHKITLPSVKEQIKISGLFKSINHRIQLQQEKIDLLKEQKKGYMRKIFSQELRFKDTDGLEYPEWSQQKLGNFSERVTRKNSNLVTTRPLTISAQHGLIDQVEFFNKTVASENLTGYYLLSKGEFAYNKSYSNGYPLGAIKRLDNYENGALSTLYICFTPKDNVNSNFLVHYFDSTQWHKEVSLICVEGARNHGLLNVSVNEFFETQHYLPCLDEQKKIANFFDQINKKIKLNEQTLFNLQQQKKAFMQQMFI